MDCFAFPRRHIGRPAKAIVVITVKNLNMVSGKITLNYLLSLFTRHLESVIEHIQQK